MVTTKKGYVGQKPEISYSYTFGTKELIKPIEVPTAPEYKFLMFEAIRNDARANVR